MPVWLRRLTQTVFLLLFLYLFLQTVYQPNGAKPGPITLFFDLDPLILLTVWLGGHAVSAALLLSLFTVAATLVFGRWFCGWICPFGTLHQLFTAMRGPKRKEKLRTAGYSVRPVAKYYILVISLFCAFFGANLAGWLDPFSFLIRSMATVVFPAVNSGIQGFFDWLYHVNPLGISVASEPVYRVLRAYFLVLEQPYYFWGMLFGLLFGVVVALNFYRARFWCRYICPLGGLLAFVGKNPTLRLRVDAEKCKDCLDCVLNCQGGAEPHHQDTWKPSECLFCWNCRSGCPTGAITFSFKRPEASSVLHWPIGFFSAPSKGSKMDFGRRHWLAAGVAGIGAGLFVRGQVSAGSHNFNPELIRPPGAVSEKEFLGTCIRCGECMKACPTNVIQPTMLEAGLEGIWTPVLKTQTGYCEYTCNMCNQVCPTEAIRPMDLEEKQQVRIGLAHLDEDRCLPLTYARPCFICQWQCPARAISMIDTTVTNLQGDEVTVKKPHVNSETCIGCGICQAKCPVTGRAAIRVTSVGETRHIENQFLSADRYGG